MKRKQSKVLSILLSLAMLCSLAMPTAFAADSRYIDTTDHWAETAINRWSDYGIIEGYGDAFNPDNSITRGQMATILSKTLGLAEEAENPFSDISADDWYYPYVLRCYKAGIMLGDDGKANPDAEITRQEAMTMFCRAFGIKAEETADLTSFKDSGAIADWALPYVSALINGGIVSGVSSDMVAPAESMSRAALVTILDRAVVQYVNASGEYDLTDKEGIILVTAGDTTLKGETKADILITQAADEKAVTFKDATVTGAVTVKADTKIINNNSKLPEIDATVEEVKKETPKKPSGGSSGGSSRPTISNLTISEEKAVTSGTYNNVTITDAVADGEVTLSNITIKGDLTINGGGSSSIKLDNCTIQGKVIMAKETGEAPRLELTNTPVATVEVQKPAIIEAVDSASAVTKIEATANIEIKGENTKIDTLAVPETAESAVAVAVTAGNISTVEAKAEISVTGASNSVDTIVATATVTADSEAVQKVEIPETATESVSVTVTGDASVDVEINSTSGAAVTGTNVTVSTTLETVPDNITVGGEAVTHIHKWGEPVTTPATCEQDGEKVYTCIAEGCDDTAKTKTEVIHSLGHKYGDWKKSDDDLHVRECANDKDHYEKQEHTWDEGKITTEANCGQDGVKTYTCSVCKGTKTETINKPDHNWGDWVKVDITSHKRVCKNNATHIETADHTPIIDSAVDATCTETGKTEGSHCDVCKSVIVEQTTTPALNHDFTGEYEKDADGHWHICERDNCEETDTKAGHTYNTTNCAEVATCTVCKYEKPAGEHTWSDWEKVDDTNHKRTCSCTATETAEHSWDNGVITTEPTPTNAGVKTYTCSVCKGTKTESVPYVPKKEINFSKSGNSIRVEWSGYTASKYIFRLFDEEGNKVAESAETSSTNYSDISIYMPTPDTGVNKYKFVLYATTANSIKELDSVEDAITITVGTDAVDYEIAYNDVAENEHSITWKNGTVPSGINYIGIWKNANGTQNEKISGAISQYGIVHRKYGYQNLTFDLRVISSFDVQDGKVELTMTPPSEKKYTEPSSVNNYTFVENYAGSPLRISWNESALAAENGYVLKFDGYDADVSTSRTVTGLATVLASTNLESGKISLGIYTGPDRANLTLVYPSKEIANITFNNTTPEFVIEKDASGSYNFVSNMSGGMWVYKLYNSDNNYCYVNNDINGAIDSYANFADGYTVKARYVTWTLNDDKTFAEFTVSNIATYTYKESVTSDVTITLVQEGDSIKATWTGTDLPNYYFEIEDSNGKYVTSGWTNGDECYTSDLSLYLPRTDVSATYSFAIYSADENYNVVEEIARLDNCFEITVLGNAVEYDMVFNDGEDGVHSVTLAGDTLPSGIRLLDAWYDSLGKLRSSGSSSISRNKTEHQAIQNGYAYDLRVLTAYALDGQTIKATMTPPSKKTYVNEDEPKIKWNDGGTIAWQAVANADDYKLNIYSGNTVDSTKLVATKNIGAYSTVYQISSNFDIAELSDNKDATFTVELLALDANDNVIETVGVLAEGINLTFTESAPEFSFEVTGEKTYTISFAEGTPNGMRYSQWYDAEGNKSGGMSGFGMTQLTNAGERAYAFADGDTIKVYIATVDTITDTVWTITRTPDAIQTYTTEETDASLLSFRKWNTDIMFDGYDDVADTKSLEVDGIKVLSTEAETMSEFLFDYDQTKGNITDADFVVEVDGVEKERISKNVDVTLSNTDVAFTINADGTLSFDATTHGSFAYKKTKGGEGRIAFKNGTLVDGWDLPTLADGETIDIMHIDCTYDETTKAISATISKHTTKTYTATTEKNIWFSEDGDGIYVEWKETELADGEKYFITMKNPESLFTRTHAEMDLGTFFDESDIVNGKLSIKIDKGTSWSDVENLYDEKEFANVTLTNTTPDFTIEKDSTGKYKFVSDLSGGAWVYTTYDGNGNLMYVGNVVDGAIDTYANFTDGHTVKARYITWALNDDNTFAEFTVSNIATYTYKEPVASDVKITLVQNGTSINATWTGANCDNGYTWALIEGGDIHQLDFVGKNVSTSTDFRPCLTRIDSGVHSYDFVLYEYDESAEDCIGKELGRLDNAIEVTITGEVVDYTMSFTAPADGQYQITLNAVPTEGNTYLTRWNRGKSNYSSIYVSDGTQTYTETTFMGALQDGDIYDLRLLTTYTLEGQTLKAVMTPPSTTTYTASIEKNIWLELDGNNLYLKFNDDADLGADEEYFLYENGNEITTDTVKAMELFWLIAGGTVDRTFSYEIKKGNWEEKTTLHSLENAVNVTVTQDIPEITIQPQADGTYKFVSSENKGYFYRIKAPNGTAMLTGYTADGTILCGIYEGCTIEVQTCVITIATDGLSANITTSSTVTIDNPSLCTALGTVVEVDTVDELVDAVNKGAIATLTSDITTNKTIAFKTGAPATINLNGYVIDSPYISIYYGKTLNIIGTTAGSGVKNSNGTTTITALTTSALNIEGGTYDKIAGYGARSVTLKNISAIAEDNTIQMQNVPELSINEGTYTATQKGDNNNIVGGIAITLRNCSNTTIDGITANGNYYAMDVYNSANVNVGNSIINGLKSGLRCNNQTSMLLENVEINSTSATLSSNNNSTITVNSGTFTSADYIMSMSSSGTININGGNFKATGDDSYIIWTNGNTNNLVILAGEFTNVTKVFQSDNENRIPSYTITGGTYDIDMTNYLADGYICTNNGDGTYTVAKTVTE